jgi:chloramphenicol 3-O-phosphotransferase
MIDEELDLLQESDLSLLETLDHILARGLVITGEITISVADIDLIFVGLNVLLTSVEKAHEVLRERENRVDSGQEPGASSQ